MSLDTLSSTFRSSLSGRHRGTVAFAALAFVLSVFLLAVFTAAAPGPGATLPSNPLEFDSNAVIPAGHLGWANGDVDVSANPLIVAVNWPAGQAVSDWGYSDVSITSNLDKRRLFHVFIHPENLGAFERCQLVRQSSRPPFVRPLHYFRWSLRYWDGWVYTLFPSLDAGETRDVQLRCRLKQTGSHDVNVTAFSFRGFPPRPYWPHFPYFRCFPNPDGSVSCNPDNGNLVQETVTVTFTTAAAGNQAPTASFTATPNPALVAQSIFFDASASFDTDGSIVSYAWDFGDGNTATGATASHAYPAAGTYNAVLTVTDDGGASATASLSISVTTAAGNQAPVASFSMTPNPAQTSQNVLFDATTSYDPDGTIATYAWDFGDGSTAGGVTAAHAYVTPGLYTVTLTVTDNLGASTSASQTLNVTAGSSTNQPPVASFTANPNPADAGQTVSFDASASYDSDGTLVWWLWDFGDGNTAISTAPTASHTYATPGAYLVSLTVVDNGGLTGSTTLTMNVQAPSVPNVPPVAGFTAAPNPALVGEVIDFVSTSYDSDGTIATYAWDFGDGNTATGATASYAYNASGNYTVTLTVTDNNGATDTATTVVTVNAPAANQAPVADFTATPNPALVGDVIAFNSLSYDPDGVIVNWAWDFGDGSTATTENATHAYAAEGNYTVTLTVTDNNGATASFSASVIVTSPANAPPEALATASPNPAFVGDTVSFTSLSYDTDGVVTLWLWNFGDGNTALGENTTHGYAAAGNYSATLTVYDDDGAVNSTSILIEVLAPNAPPEALATASPNPAFVGDTVSFTSLSYDTDGFIASWLWDFGNGDTATTENVSYAYNASGNYSVTLTVTDDDGAANSTSFVMVVLPANQAPVANFTASPNPAFVGDTVSFTSLSYDADGVIVGWFWDFGDGANASTENATHAYAMPGNYSVTLTVTDDDGAANSTTLVVEIQPNPANVPPVAGFTAAPNPALVGEVIDFVSTSTDADGFIVSWAWDFGDGNTATGATASYAYNASGNYTVTLTVTDNNGATDSFSLVVEVLAPNAPPEALATASPNPASVGQFIDFTSLSYDADGVIVGWFWDFGDGANASTENATHAYAMPGNYSVTLTVTDDDGATNSTTIAVTIVANLPPVASFTATPNPANVSESIFFDASASYDPDGSIASYGWDFGDGTTSTGLTTTYAYSAAGTYTVTLTVTDDQGETGTFTLDVTVETLIPPEALADATPNPANVSQPVSFTSLSYDTDGFIASWLWDFGDGSALDTNENTVHAYNASGAYSVTLTVWDDDGLSNFTVFVVTVLNQAPVADFTATPNPAFVGDTVSFTSLSYDADGVIVGWFWDFGDGANATTENATHAYAMPGNYSVTLTVTDDDGAANSTSLVMEVLVPADPVYLDDSTLNATYYLLNVIPGTALVNNSNFTGSDADTSNIAYSVITTSFIRLSTIWNCVITNSQLPSGGVYVDCTITDSWVDPSNVTNSNVSGGSIVFESTVVNSTIASSTVNYSTVVNSNLSGSTVLNGTVSNSTLSNSTSTFSNVSGSSLSNSSVSNSTVSNSTLVNSNVTGSNVSNSNLTNSTVVNTTLSNSTLVDANVSDGTIYNGSITYSNGTMNWTYNASANGTANLTDVIPYAPVASFTAAPNPVLVGQAVSFNAGATSDPNIPGALNDVLTYAWNFGDGSTGTGVTTGHAYGASGTFTVTLTVTDAFGLTSTTTLAVTVNPQASFSPPSSPPSSPLSSTSNNVAGISPTATPSPTPEPTPAQTPTATPSPTPEATTEPTPFDNIFAPTPAPEAEATPAPGLLTGLFAAGFFNNGLALLIPLLFAALVAGGAYWYVKKRDEEEDAQRFNPSAASASSAAQATGATAATSGTPAAMEPVPASAKAEAPSAPVVAAAAGVTASTQALKPAPKASAPPRSNALFDAPKPGVSTATPAPKATGPRVRDSNGRFIPSWKLKLGNGGTTSSAKKAL